ncbi:MAG TPA: hypothetical protein VIM08_09245 [Arthrobacter sp.]|jgi:hypothetical protein
MRRKHRNDDEGRYVVATATESQYELDLTARTLKRQMAAAPPIFDFLDACFSRLRRDEETIELPTLGCCAVGASIRYYLQTRDDRVLTLSMTSSVVRIGPMAILEA